MERRYPILVQELAKPGEAILRSLTPEKCHMWHMASAVNSEAGEAFDAVKRYVIYNKDLDREHLIEELGDIEFYLEGLRQSIAVSRDEVLAANVVKLSKRFPSMQYTDLAAQLRADKEPGK